MGYYDLPRRPRSRWDRWADAMAVPVALLMLAMAVIVAWAALG